MWQKLPYECEITWSDGMAFLKKFYHKGEILVTNGDTGTCDETILQP